MNRQQKRATERVKGKELNKKLTDLKVNATNKKELENYNVAKWAMGLTEKEKTYLNKLMIDSSRVDLDMFSKAWNIVLGAEFDKKTATELIDLVVEEGLKINEYMESGGDYIMAIKNNKEAILKDYRKGKKGNIKESDIIKDLAINYKVTATVIKGLIKEAQTEEALEYIFEEKKEVSKNEGRFKVLKEVISRDVQGRHGIYHVTNNKVEIEGLTFNTKEDVEKVAEDKIKEIQKQMQEQIDNANKCKEEVIALIDLYL